MISEKEMDRIRKLSRLQESSNEHEAALAAEKMTALLLKNNLDLAQLDLDPDDPNEPTLDRATAEYFGLKDLFGYGANQKWLVRLMSMCAENFSCSFLLDVPGHRFIFVGQPEDIQAAVEVSKLLHDRLVNLAKIKTREYTDQFKLRHGYSPVNGITAHKPVRWRYSWLHGAVSGIGDKMAAARYNVGQASNNKALLDTRSTLAKQKTRQEFGQTGTYNADGVLNKSAYFQGRQDGKQLQTGRSIAPSPNGGEQKQIGG